MEFFSKTPGKESFLIKKFETTQSHLRNEHTESSLHLCHPYNITQYLTLGKLKRRHQFFCTNLQVSERTFLKGIHINLLVMLNSSLTFFFRLS